MLPKITSILLTIVVITIFGCSLQSYKKLTPEESKSEMGEVVNAIKSKPDWLEPSEMCPSELVPSSEKKIFYSEDECENSPKLCFERCRKDDGNACYALALLIQKKMDIDAAEPNPLFLRSCKLGIISGCTNRAAFKLDLDSTDQEDSKCAADTFEKTCAMNDPWGCSMYGTMLAYGHGREQNIEEALKYLQKACDRFSSEDDACKGAMQVKEQIEQDKKDKQSNDSNSNSKNRTR